MDHQKKTTKSSRDRDAIIIIQPEVDAALRSIRPELGIPRRELRDCEVVTIRQRPAAVAADSAIPFDAVGRLARLHVLSWRCRDRRASWGGRSRGGGIGRRGRYSAATGNTHAVRIVDPETHGAVRADGRVPRGKLSKRQRVERHWGGAILSRLGGVPLVAARWLAGLCWAGRNRVNGSGRRGHGSAAAAAAAAAADCPVLFKVPAAAISNTGLELAVWPGDVAQSGVPNPERLGIDAVHFNGQRAVATPFRAGKVELVFITGEVVSAVISGPIRER